MSDLQRFGVCVVGSALVFVAVLWAVLRHRTKKPVLTFCWLSAVVVVLGMVFARYGHIWANLPWWIYYGAPAAATFILPPLALRMQRSELVRYLPSAILMAPAIHVFLSLFVGWHDYMPFPFRIPSLIQIFH